MRRKKGSERKRRRKEKEERKKKKNERKSRREKNRCLKKSFIKIGLRGFLFWARKLRRTKNAVIG